MLPTPAVIPPAIMSTPAPGTLIQHPTPPPEVQHSALHNGLYLQLSRDLRPVWGPSPPSLPPAPLRRAVCGQLLELQELTQQDITGGCAPGFHSDLASLAAVLHMSAARQLLGLWGLITEHNSTTVLQSLTPNSLEQMKAASLRELVQGGTPASQLTLAAVQALYSYISTTKQVLRGSLEG